MAKSKSSSDDKEKKTSHFIRIKKPKSDRKKKGPYNSAIDIVGEDFIYLHNSPYNFLKTYEEIKVDKIYGKIIKQQKDIVDKDFEKFEDARKNILKGTEFYRIDQLTNALNKTCKDMSSWGIYTPRNFKAANATGADRLRKFFEVWNGRTEKLLIRLEKVIKKLNWEDEIESKYLQEYEKLQNIYQEYQKLMERGDEEGYRAAYDKITSQFAPHKRSEGWLWEAIMADFLKEQSFEKIFTSSVQIKLVGKEMKISDIDITIGSTTFGLNLKLNDSFYKIERKMSFDKKTDKKVINTFYYLLYNTYNLGRISNADLGKVLKYLKKIWVYQGLHLIFRGNNETIPYFIVFRNKFIPTTKVFEYYFNQIDARDDDINFMDISIEQTKEDMAKFNKVALMAEKNRVFEKLGRDIGYKRLYEEIKTILPKGQYSTKYTFYIDKDNVKGVK